MTIRVHVDGYDEQYHDDPATLFNVNLSCCVIDSVPSGVADLDVPVWVPLKFQSSVLKSEMRNDAERIVKVLFSMTCYLCFFKNRYFN